MAPPGKVAGGPANLARSALLVGAVASALCAAAGLIFDGVSGSVSALAAAMLVLVFFLTGQVVEGLTLRMADWNGLTITVACFVLRVALFGAALWVITTTPAIGQAWANAWFAAGALASLIGWQAGLVMAHARVRVPVYDRGYQAPAGWDQ